MNCSKDRGKTKSARQLISSKISFFHSPFVPRMGYPPPNKNPPGTPSLMMSMFESINDFLYTLRANRNISARLLLRSSSDVPPSSRGELYYCSGNRHDRLYRSSNRFLLPLDLYFFSFPTGASWRVRGHDLFFAQPEANTKHPSLISL